MRVTATKAAAIRAPATKAAAIRAAALTAGPIQSGSRARTILTAAPTAVGTGWIPPAWIGVHRERGRDPGRSDPIRGTTAQTRIDGTNAQPRIRGTAARWRDRPAVARDHPMRRPALPAHSQIPIDRLRERGRKSGPSWAGISAAASRVDRP